MRRFIKMEVVSTEDCILPFSGIKWTIRYSAAGRFRIYCFWYGSVPAGYGVFPRWPGRRQINVLFLCHSSKIPSAGLPDVSSLPLETISDLSMIFFNSRIFPFHSCFFSASRKSLLMDSTCGFVFSAYTFRK